MIHTKVSILWVYNIFDSVTEIASLQFKTSYRESNVVFPWSVYATNRSILYFPEKSLIHDIVLQQVIAFDMPSDSGHGN